MGYHTSAFSFLYLIRRFISVLLKYSPSNKFKDLLLWPVSKRLFKNYNEVVKIDDGVYLKVYGDMADMVNKLLLFTSDYVSLAWEPGTARFIKFLSDKCSFAIVAGSHIGYYPVIIGQVNHDCKIYAFEPNPINKSRCLDNIRLNDLDNVTVVDKALGNNVGQGRMYFNFGQSSLVDSRRKYEDEGVVDITTLDKFGLDFNGNNTLLVLDAEGYEKNIIEGGIDFISKNKPMIVFELNENALRSAGSSSVEFCGLLKNLGYNLYVIDEGSHNISFCSEVEIRLIPYEKYVFKEIPFVNAFAIIDNEPIKRYVYQT